MKNNYKEDGMIIIDDFLPLDVAHQLEHMFTEQENWKLLDQVREEHYGEFLKTDLEHFPDGNLGASMCIKRDKKFFKKIKKKLGCGYPIIFVMKFYYH